MLLVDPALTGRKVCIRPSMEKFEAPDALDLEIAEVFNSPKAFFLNRPYINLLGDRGVPTHAFLQLQRRHVAALETKSRTLAGMAEVLRHHSLGGPFDVPKLFTRMAGVGLAFDTLPPPIATFLQNAATYASIHILRDLKFHARIPLTEKEGITLVGGMDESMHLDEAEIYVAVDRSTVDQADAIEYLEGPVFVSRSPTMHPGDVRKFRAIGRPPRDSPFLQAQRNVVVFSGKGQSRHADGYLELAETQGLTLILQDKEPTPLSSQAVTWTVTNVSEYLGPRSSFLRG